MGLTLVASWLALEFGLKFRVTSILACAVIKRTISLAKELGIVAYVWNSCMEYWIRDLNFEHGKKEKYLDKVKDRLGEISTSEGSIHHQIKEIFFTETFLQLDSDGDDTPGKNNREKQSMSLRRRWKKFRKSKTDEERTEREK